MLNMLIYTQGLVSMIVAGGLEIDRQTAYALVHEAAAAMIHTFTNTEK